jgi:polyisoprenoid-binding protein YceI
MRRNLFLSIVGLSVVALFACANPADGVPEAGVAEPAAAPGADHVNAGDGVALALDESSSITWVGSKITGSHDGGFKSFTGGISLVDGDPTRSSVHVTIDTTTLWADNEKLTGHLKSADFFDVATYPEATFRSTAIQPANDGGFEITGDLTLHGVTKSITFPASIEVTDGSVSAKAEFVLMRFDFGIVYPGKPDDLIRDEVVVRFDLRASAPAA